MSSVTSSKPYNKRSKISSLESLPNDVKSYIFSYLDLQSIFNTSLTCYNNYISCYNEANSTNSSSLWKYKFLQRWNYIPSSSSEEINWNEWYKEMYNNPNDLWCFHENITWPCDGYVDGYCAIPPQDTNAKKSFSKFHKDLNINQYKFNAPVMITDLLFFPIYNKPKKNDSHTFESRRILDISEDMTLLHKSNTKLKTLETSYHSWCIIKLVNPQYVRPIHYKIYLQTESSDANLIQIFPNDGYIPCGSFVTIIFSISNYGSWNSFIQQCIITRFICIQYWYSTVIPSITTTSAERRCMYLNAHIHPYYALDEFHAFALQPAISTKPSFYIAPHLQYNYPILYSKIKYNRKVLHDNYIIRKKTCMTQYEYRNRMVQHWISCYESCTTFYKKEFDDHDIIDSIIQNPNLIDKLQRIYYLYYELHSKYKYALSFYYIINEELENRLHQCLYNLVENVTTIQQLFNQLNDTNNTYTSSTIWKISKDIKDKKPLSKVSNDYTKACNDITSLSQTFNDIYKTFYKPHLLHNTCDSMSYPGSIIRCPRLYNKECLLNYLFHVPYPGCCSNDEEDVVYPISKWKKKRNDNGKDDIIIVSAVNDYIKTSIHTTVSNNTQSKNSPIIKPLYNPKYLKTASNNQQQQQPRLIDVLANHYLGFNPNTTITIVDRRVLISLQWLANTIYLLPIFTSCLVRCMEWISNYPFSYVIPDLYYYSSETTTVGRKQLRYLSIRECKYVCIILVVLWLMIGRYIERYIGRTMERELLEQMTNQKTRQNLRHKIQIIFLKLYDSICPRLLQNIIHIPYWNKRTFQDLISLHAKKRIHDLWEYNRYKFHCDYGNGIIGVGQSLHRPFQKSNTWMNQLLKFLLIVLTSVFSFMICSPWFLLNLWIVFYCSISLGLSLTIQSLEITQPQSSTQDVQQNNQSISPTPLLTNLSNLKLHILINLFILLGQLLGSSGGSIFLAEFVVTTVSLLLGGISITTISSNNSNFESWICFLSLCIVSFFGFMISRLGLLYIIRKKKSNGVLFMMIVAIVIVFLGGIGILLFCRFELVRTIVIVPNFVGSNSKKKIGRTSGGSSGNSSQKKLHAFIPS